MCRTLIAAQQYARLLAAIKPREYESYFLNPLTAGLGYQEIDVGGDLQTKYGSEWRVPCNNGFIVTSKNLQLTFNNSFFTEDLVKIDIATMGNVWQFSRGDLLIDKILLKKPYSTADEPVVKIFVSGVELLCLSESP